MKRTKKQSIIFQVVLFFWNLNLALSSIHICCSLILIVCGQIVNFLLESNLPWLSASLLHLIFFFQFLCYTGFSQIVGLRKRRRENWLLLYRMTFVTNYIIDEKINSINIFHFPFSNNPFDPNIAETCFMLKVVALHLFKVQIWTDPEAQRFKYTQKQSKHRKMTIHTHTHTHLWAEKKQFLEEWRCLVVKKKIKILSGARESAAWLRE